MIDRGASGKHKEIYMMMRIIEGNEEQVQGDTPVAGKVSLSKSRRRR